MQIRHILAPVDFSDFSAKSLQVASKFAAEFWAKLTVIYVHETLEAGPTAAEDAAQLAAFVAANVSGLLPNVDQQVLLGHAAYESLEWAEENAVDMIVCGTHGRTGLGRVLLGSVAEKIARGAHCPVMVVRAAPDVLKGQRLIFSTDLLPTSDSALRLTKLLAKTFENPVMALHVLDKPKMRPAAEKAMEPIFAEAKIEAEQRIQSLDFGEGVKVERRVMIGRPTDAIIDMAETTGADLIVCGTHGRSSVQRLLLGSVSGKVLRLARCSVLVVPFLPGA